MFKRAVHPGEVLKDELEDMGITPTAFARRINVPPNHVLDRSSRASDQ